MTFANLKCTNCGAPLRQNFEGNQLSCDYCGCQLIYSGDSKIEPYKNTIHDLVNESNEIIILFKKGQIEKLEKKIKFLEEQYLLTKHKSIPEKIQKIKRNIIQLTSDFTPQEPTQ